MRIVLFKMSLLNITGETDNCDPLRGLIIRELREASIRRREEVAEEEKEEEHDDLDEGQKVDEIIRYIRWSWSDLKVCT